MSSTSLNRAGSAARKALLTLPRTGFTAAVLLGFLALAPAQEIPALVELSPEVAAARPDLAGQRAALVQEREALHARVNQHNERCKDIDPNNKGKISDCANEQAALFSAMKAHVARSEAFNAAAQVASAEQRGQKRAGAASAVTNHLLYRGDFYVLTADGQRLAGDANTSVAMGSKIVTGRNSQVKVTLLDDTQLTIGPNAEVVIDDFAYDASSKVARFTANLVQGSLRWVEEANKWIEENRKPRKIRTVAHVTSVRGTDAEFFVAPDGAGYIKLLEGQLEITETKTGHVFLMDAREIVRFKADGTFGRLMPLKR